MWSVCDKPSGTRNVAVEGVIEGSPTASRLSFVAAAT